MASEFTPLLGKTIKFTHPQHGEDERGRAIFRRHTTTGKVEKEVPGRREVLIDNDFHRFEDIEVLEVEGQPLAAFLAGAPDAPPLAPPPPPVERWNVRSKTVLNHETGEINIERTNETRAKLGLPVPWTKEIGSREIEEPPVFETES